MGKKKTEIKLGPLTIGAKAIAVVFVLLIAVLGFIFVGKPMLAAKKAAKQAELEAESDGPAYEKRVYAINEIVGGNYYIKDGDAFYPVAQGALKSTAARDTAVAKMADPANRSLYFAEDDATIPTMYSDSALIFKAQDGETIPSVFVLERFKENGWSLGISGLKQTAVGTLNITVDGATFYPGSTISKLNVQDGNELVFDKIDGLPFGKNVLSSVGTINGLDQGQDYKIDAYVGTNYVGMSAKADTHVFISMELYTLNEYAMDPSGFLSVSFPHDMWSGYYYINGAGLFRYINQPKAMGDNVEDFNTPYYLYNADGQETINPANGYGSSASADSTWDYSFSVPMDTTILEANLTYQGNRASGIPEATLISPNGGKYSLSPVSDTDINHQSAKIEFPTEGKWRLTMAGMTNRIFDIDISFGDPVSGEIEAVKKTDDKVEMYASFPKLNNAMITFVWDNREYAGRFLVTGPEGIKFGNQETPYYVAEETYGKVVLKPGKLPEGDYDITVDGKALGHIVMTFEDLEENQPEETQPAEGEGGEAASEAPAEGEAVQETEAAAAVETEAAEAPAPEAPPAEKRQEAQIQ